ncbi:conjugal transfer protein TrbB [Acidithiobacillus thiooxidans]|uniref:Conjugal transfer protein TrbB n=1 Tax=Acidithiobacillus thiooxidans TaxID=930 RepID=A0A1C2IJS6_ACITH|nr:P-type conjugative transfer ATPase TrbB [Acidithiobacillus thiooxidans]OCX72298.1 conjugal transfer protein TrbB [Acidithiobacillus thiooxidans]OCX76263.1 conjugal transfer protein TrbB [Acidithiobacillus thiooxidans]OCX78485.1 conjugal transfer protein TrbB [Acidithiobacillus thiooxidans]OCX89266.1 conjugal transfer protein TrbB [Acidithiobacillus thiooxidans]OFC42619.1 P-type conjugative transfer ATPase TrbB [Acidithiobacillus thiooxidans]
MADTSHMDKAQQERHTRLIEQMRRILGSEICAVFEDPSAVEIMLNDDGKILVERHGEGITHLNTMPAAKALNLLSLMADYRGVTVSREKPIVEGAMPDEFLRARFAGAIPPLMPMPTFSIRLPARKIYTLEDYRNNKIITGDQCDRIIEAVESRKNILVSGGTSSGKTTLLNAISDAIASHSGLGQRIVIIEDTREIVCNAPNTVSMLTDADSEIDMTRLLKLTLRYRPDRIFVGEVRDGAALALLKAWNTGHPGGLATLHANNPMAALTRLDQLCQEANVPPQPELIREAVDLVIQIQRDPSSPAGRRITHIYDVKQPQEA